MRKEISYQKIISLVLVFFLFTPVLLRSLNEVTGTPANYINFTKAPASHTKTDSQLLFEEKEKEEKNSGHAFSMFAVLYEVATLSTFSTVSTIPLPTIDRVGFFFDTPIYLTKRSLLI